MIWIVLIAIVLVVVIAVIAVSWRRNARGEEDDPLQARLAEFIQRGDVTSLEEIELSQPFSQRVLVPLINRLGEFLPALRRKEQYKVQQGRWNWQVTPGQSTLQHFLLFVLY